MKPIMNKTLSFLLACLLGMTAVTALADTAATEADGSVINTMETPVTVSYSGVIEKLNVREGKATTRASVSRR